MNPELMTQREFEALPRRDVTVEQWIKLCGGLDIPADEAAGMIVAAEDGSFLGVYSQDQGRTFQRLHLKRIWIRNFNLQYPTTNAKGKKGRVGKELLISNLPLPPGPVVQNQTT